MTTDNRNTRKEIRLTFDNVLTELAARKTGKFNYRYSCFNTPYLQNWLRNYVESRMTLTV